MLIAVVGVNVLSASPAHAFVDFADFTWISPSSDPDGDLKYDVSGMTSIRLDIAAKPGYRFDRVTVQLSTQPASGPTVNYPTLCVTDYPGLLPTDFPTSIAVDVNWSAGVAPASSVGCTGGATATSGAAMPAGTHYLSVTVREALEVATVTEGVTRALELSGGGGGCTTDCGGCQANCGGSTTTTTTTPDGGPTTTTTVAGATTATTTPGRGTATTTPGGGTGSDPDCTGRCGRSGDDDGAPTVAGNTESRPESGPGSAGSPTISGDAERVRGDAQTAELAFERGTSVDIGVAARVRRAPTFAVVGFSVSGLLVLVGMAILGHAWWVLFGLRRRKDEEDEEEQTEREISSLV